MSAQKSRVVEAFSQSAHRYDQASQVQMDVAAELAKIALSHIPDDPDVLEIGCGTGGLTAHVLRGIEGGRFVVTDIAPAMVDACREACDDPRVTFLAMDGEAPDLGERQFDLIVSSLAFQWFGDLGAAISTLSAHLKPGGRLVFSTLGQETFANWRKSHAELGLKDGTPLYPSLQDLSTLWPAGGLGEIQEAHIVRPYENAQMFARRLKTIGANTPKDGHRPLSPKDFKRIAEYLGENFTDSYHILYGVFIKA